MAETNKNNSKNEHLITVILCTVAIPLSMSFWIINLLYSKFITNHEGFDEPLVISPTRWLVSCLIPLILAVHGYRRKKVNLDGAIVGGVVAFILTLSNYSFLACIFTFFMSSSKATNVRAHIKKKLEADFKEGGQRNWIQVVCNSGMATQLALLYLLDVGAGERPIDFVKYYRSSWLTIGVLAVFACANGDTWASELGTVFSNSDPFLITTFKRVPKGTNGGVSFLGLVFSTLGGMLVGLVQYLTLLYFSDTGLWAFAPPQWPLIVFGGIGGLVGSLVDSILGATCQYSGVDTDGRIVTHSNPNVKHVSGRNILDNHSVNLLSTVFIGLFLPTISKSLWPSF